MNRRLGFFERRRAPVEWLRRVAEIPEEQARNWVDLLGIFGDSPLRNLAANPRTLLALAAAWAQGADGVVFCGAGCDPLGIQTVREAVVSRLENCPAIELSFPLIQNGQPFRDCHPVARCLEVTSPTGTIAPARIDG